MARGDTFFAGMKKTVLRSHIQKRLQSFGMREEFQDVLLSDLISEKHYYCSVHGLRPTHFRMLERPGSAYDFQGLFPGNRWHGVSWTQCLNPRNQDEWIETALRQAIQHFVAAKKHQFPVCEKCNVRPTTEVDHVAPEFAEILRHALNTMSPGDYEEAFLSFNWWDEKPFVLPPHNPALQYALNAHESCVLEAVCKNCHLSNAKERKANKLKLPDDL